jgi:peptidoglycan/xylan/chitin deacetylase (PgdA/CDA1 family)
MYHRVAEPDSIFPSLDVRDFRRHLDWLLDRCRVVSPDSLPARSREGGRQRSSVILTFDDGYRDYHDHVYPLLKSRGVPAVNFVATDFVDHPRLAWWDLLHLAVRTTSVPSVRLFWDGERVLDLQGEGRRRLLRACKAHVKSASDAEKERILNGIWEQLEFSPAAVAVPRQTMNWDEIRAVGAVTTIGGHTHTHPLLTRVDPGRAEMEVATCRRRLIEETGMSPRLFAYPSGDFDDSVKRIVKGCGFDVAFSTEEGINGPDADWLAVRRFAAEQSVPDLAWVASGLGHYGSRLQVGLR